MDYKIASARNPKELTENVKNLIKDGWEPIGGICFADTPVGQMVFQTMIKKQ